MTSEKDAPAEMPGEIEHDPYDLTREYIPLPGGWEVQTKGAGSSYRLLDKKTGERFSILSGKDWAPLQAFFTRFAHEVFAASRDERKEAASLSPAPTSGSIPCAPNTGRYLAETNDGRLLYLNHANEWQECPNFLRQAATKFRKCECASPMVRCDHRGCRCQLCGELA